jgi:hypothetical protein
MCFFYLELVLMRTGSVSRGGGSAQRGARLGGMRTVRLGERWTASSDDPARRLGCGRRWSSGGWRFGGTTNGEQGRERKASGREREGARVGREEGARSGFIERGEERASRGERERDDRPSMPSMAAANNSVVDDIR